MRGLALRAASTLVLVCVQQWHRGLGALLDPAYELEVVEGKPDRKASRIMMAPHLVELLQGEGGAERPAIDEHDELLLIERMAWQRCIDSGSAATMLIIQWLAAIFRREPIPASPIQSTRDASASNIGSTAVRAESGPEARMVSSPSSAG
jgi:hypothetical protein